ncbi:MAG: Smr/MutS family protein [Pseudomonadota bacterium]
MAKRRDLDPADKALWDAVTGDVTPLARSETPPVHRFPRVAVRAQQAVPPPSRPNAFLAAPERASLDGSWDRRVRKGQIRPDRTIDLHGLTSDGAYHRLVQAVGDASRAGLRTLLVITGKPRGSDEAPRGIIAKSLPVWLETPQLRPFVAATRRAHPKHGGAGAVYVVLRRAR